LFRIKKEARRCKKDFEKIRFKMMFKTTPDSMDALKICPRNPLWQEVPDEPAISASCLPEVGYKPVLTKQNDAIYNK
jgi:hypothetical protein